MKTLKLLITILICTTLSGCVGAVFSTANLVYHQNKVKKEFNDISISMQINRRILDNEALADYSHISVHTFKGLVLLTGSVTNQQYKHEATDAAAKVHGVRHIYNQLRIGPPISAWRGTQDTWVTAKIKAKIMSAAGMDPSKIKVVTVNGVVYLMGIVPRRQANIATYIASRTEGVKKVVRIFFYVIMPKIQR